MPNIPTYNVGPQGFRPTDMGIDAAVQSARRIGGIYNDVASAERQTGNQFAEALGQGVKAAGDAAVAYMDHQQISAGQPAALQLMDGLQQQANAILKNSDPNNQAVYGKFRDDVMEPALEKFQESFTTENSQRWAMEQANGIREHLHHTIIADMSTMAANAVTVNLNQSANAASNLVFNDPSALDFTLRALEHSTGAVVASSLNITPEDAGRVKGEVLQKIRETVVRAAVQGAIAKNPDAGLAMAQDPKYAPYINGAEANTLYKESVRANKADALLQRQIQHEKLEQNSDAQEQRVMESYFNPDPTAPRIPVKDILMLQGVTAAAKSRMLNIAYTSANKMEVSEAQSAENSAAMMHDIWNGKITDIDTLRDAVAQNKIRYGDYKHLEGEFLNPNDPASGTLRQSRADFFRSYSSVVNPIYADGTRDPENSRREYNLLVYAHQQDDQIRAKGGNPADLYDPFSKDFIGRSPLAQPITPAQHQQYFNAMARQKDLPGNLNPDMVPSASAIPTVKSVDDVAKLPKSVRYFLTPDGRKKLNPNYQAP
jgi:hypothetical protein